MESKDFINIQAFFNCLSEGIVAYYSDNRIISNNAFLRLFNVKKDNEKTIIDILKKHGLEQMFNSDADEEKEFYWR